MEHHTHQFQHHGDLTTHLVDGDAVSTSIKGAFGKTTFLDHQGNVFARTEPNAYGGKDIFHGEHLVSKTSATKLGYHDLLTGHNSQIHAHGTQTAVGHDGVAAATIQHLGHGFTSVMSYADPLMHVGQYVMPLLKL